MVTKRMIVTNYCNKTNMYRLQEVNPSLLEKNYGTDVLFLKKERELKLNAIYEVEIPELLQDFIFIKLETVKIE